MTLHIKKETALTFDDILLLPKKSNVKSRLDVSLKSRLYRDVYLDIPIISANMDTVTGDSMLKAMNNIGAAGIVHRFLTPKEHAEILKENCGSGPIIVSIGVKDEDLERIELLINDPDISDKVGVCIDV